MNTATPPRWAEGVLGVLLAPQDRQTVSGDLLEEYRENIYPARGRRRADMWYVAQVAGFAWRANRMWAVLLGGAFVARTAVDWLVPTADFHARSAMSTAVTAGFFLCAGFMAAWRSNSVGAGTLAGIATALIAAAVSVVGAAFLLGMWHDPQTFAAIEGSGGLGEVFTLPLMLVAPGAFLGTLGGLLGGALGKITPYARKSRHTG